MIGVVGELMGYVTRDKLAICWALRIKRARLVALIQSDSALKRLAVIVHNGIRVS